MSTVLMLLLAAPVDEQVNRAGEVFNEGLRRQEAGLRSRSWFIDAAELYEEVLAEVPSPGLFRALGNSRRLAGDLPRAILAYRLGLRIAPHDAALRVCLESAREQVPFEGGLGQPGDEALVPLLSPGHLFLLFALGWAAGCLAFTRFVMTRHRAWILTVVMALGVAGGFGGWWLMAAMRPAPPPLAVISVDGTLLRRGDGKLFAPRYTQPLHRGTEAVVIRARGDWRLIEVSGGVGWVPAASLVEE